MEKVTFSHTITKDACASLKTLRKSGDLNTFTRAFPGPAGLSSTLGLEVENQVANEGKNSSSTDNNSNLHLTVYKPTYKKLIYDFGLNESSNPLNYLTLQVVTKASCRKGKRDIIVPFLGLLLSSISQEHGIKLKFIDSTNEVYAVVHQDVWQEIGGDLKINSAFALMQVAVMNCGNSRPPISLYISKKNIISIYTEIDSNQIEVQTFNKISTNDLRNSCQEWLGQMGINPGIKSLFESEIHSSNKKDKCQKAEIDCKDTWDPGKFMEDFNTYNFVEAIELPRKRLNNVLSRENCDLKSAKFEDKVSKKIHFQPTTPSKMFIGSETIDDSKSQQRKSPSHELSPTEKLMVEEVLSGINFEDFDC